MALLPPVALSLGGALALRAPPAVNAAAGGDGAAAAKTIVGKDREYLPLRIPLDITLANGLGRVRANLAVAIETRDPASLERQWAKNLEAAQRDFAEIALREVERRIAGPGIDPDLVDLRLALPDLLRDEMNAELSTLRPPKAVLELFIVKWEHARSDLRSATPAGAL
ncbi:MAG: hypothetical protein AAFP13_13135 [Pseudomonadota bacterium]